MWYRHRYLLGKYLLLFLLLTSTSSELYAQWEATIKTIAQGTYNTRLFLNYSPLQSEEKEFQVEISFRIPTNHRVIHATEFYLTTREAQLFNYPFDLPKGEYEVEIDILDLESQIYVNLSRTYQCNYEANALSVSNIFLATESAQSFEAFSPILQPIPILTRASDSVFFYLEIYAPGYEQIPAEAILFSPQQHEQPQTKRYTEREKKFKQLPVSRGRAIFTGGFDITQLEVGNYRILININEGTSVNTTTRFIIKGDIQQRIFEHIDESIRMMKYIIPEQRIDELLDIADPDRRKDSLLYTWEQLYPNTPDQPFRAEMEFETYYRKIYRFIDSVAYENEDWNSHRAKVYLMYGEPDGSWEQISRFEKDQKLFERWTYYQYNLSFTFERRNNQYILIE